MQLKFYARGDLLVTVPGFAPAVGQPLPRVGRDPVSRAKVPPATREAFEIDANTDAGRRLKKIAKRDQSLWPADKATADECGMALPDLEFKDGEWLPKVASPAPVTTDNKRFSTKGSE